ncbi:histidine phosphatase family protein [Pluralibacter gergoviae]
MKVILARHAETEWNRRGIIQGHSDSAVTRRGMREADALAAALEKNAFSIARVYASPLGRARLMGQRLAASFHCPLFVEPALKEQSFGRFEGMASDYFTHHYPADAEALFMRDAEYCPPGGESLVQASRRIIDFLDHQQNIVMNNTNTICIVSHGHVIQGVLALLKEGHINHFPRYSQPNASYSVFALTNGTCTDLQWGIASHLLHLER